MKSVAIAGSTGSIGRQALQVISDSPGYFEVTAIGANSNVALLVEQAKRFHPKFVCLFDESFKNELIQEVPVGSEVVCGKDSIQVLSEAADLILNAIVGFAGISVTLNSLKLNKILALANKESLVAGGDVVDKIKRESLGEIIPVDSEHSAIFQCLKNENTRSVDKILLTGSGGPFRGRKAFELGNVTIADALNHPTWNMGPKITVDSSTLMNKALEIIEARYLFGVSVQDIDVVIHPQSIVHSMVNFKDGTTIAQLAMPTMCLPISYALNYPDRGNVPYGTLDFVAGLDLSFEGPDKQVFRSLDFAYEAGTIGRSLPTIVNAANEVAVDAFLSGKIKWLSIFDVVEHCMNSCEVTDLQSVEDVVNSDFNSRHTAVAFVNGLT
jgi:1-deoxy-D-xylulose-5-phosphate reductoisomerase